MKQSFLSTIIIFLKSEHSVDALRNTLAVVLPIVVFFYLGWPTMAIGAGIGALMICMTDLPGNRAEKFSAAWISVLLFALIAFTTAWSTNFPLVMISLVVWLTFMLTMLGVLGQRMAAVGLMGIILATFTIGLKPKDALLYGYYIFLGGVWYHAISLLQIYLFPYRSLQRAIAQTAQETAALLKLRAKGYDPRFNLSGFNESNIRLHLKLANRHELIRQLLLSDRMAMSHTNLKGRLYLEKAISLIDLYEQVSAVHYDYPYLRQLFKDTALLPLLQQSITLLAEQLLGKAAALGQQEQTKAELLKRSESLNPAQATVLRQILLNIAEIQALIHVIRDPVVSPHMDESALRYRDFLSTSAAPVQALKSHFSMASPIFRFALRLAVLCLVALIAITWLSNEHYSYWLLLTMVIVSRPHFGQTIKRNGERLGGTLCGLLLGWAITQTTAIPWQLGLSVFTLYGFFAFNRIAYSVSVVCITVAVMLCLNVYDGNLLQIITDRFIYTIAGVLLCLGATFLFPIWNAPRLNDLIKQVMQANAKYFNAAIKLMPNNTVSIHQTRLARKQSHQQLAALSEAIQAAQKEPFCKRLNWALIKRLQLLNYQFNVLTATFAALKKQGHPFLTTQEIELITANLAQWNAQGTSINLHSQLVPPPREDRPMDLIEVSSGLSSLLGNTQLANH
jgi:uncharacterized membrane protein YccC